MGAQKGAYPDFPDSLWKRCSRKFVGYGPGTSKSNLQGPRINSPSLAGLSSICSTDADEWPSNGSFNIVSIHSWKFAPGGSPTAEMLKEALTMIGAAGANRGL